MSNRVRVRPAPAACGPRNAYPWPVAAARNTAPAGPAERAHPPTLGDLRGGQVLGPPAAALDDEQLAATVGGVRLAGQDAGGPNDVLLAESCPASIPAGVVAVVARRAPRGSRSVPVLVAPEGATWAQIIDDVADVLGADPARRAAGRARSALRAPLVEGGGWDRIAEIAATLLGAPVAFLDDHLDVLAAHPDGAPGLVAAVGEGDVGLSGVLEAADDGALRAAISGPGGRPVGVLLAGLDGPPAASEEAVLREVSAAASLEWSRQELRTATESQLRGDLIRELMAGESISRESLIRRGRHLGADLSGGAVAVLGAIGDPASPDPPDERVVRRLLRQARGIIDMHWPRALLDWDAGRLLVLLPGPRDEATADRAAIESRAHGLATRLIASSADAVPGLTLAISRFTSDPERLGSALEEAGLALSIGSRLGRAGDVITFEETGTYKLLFQIFAERPEELSGFYEQTIEPLVRYDEQYQTELVGTMSTYLELDCNLAATASTLYTHRHTVRYRLDRIAELSGLDIGRTDDREKLTLGLKAMRLLGKRVPVPMAKEAATRQAR